MFKGSLWLLCGSCGGCPLCLHATIVWHILILIMNLTISITVSNHWLKGIQFGQCLHQPWERWLLKCRPPRVRGSGVQDLLSPFLGDVTCSLSCFPCWLSSLFDFRLGDITTPCCVVIFLLSHFCKLTSHVDNPSRLEHHSWFGLVSVCTPPTHTHTNKQE